MRMSVYQLSRENRRQDMNYTGIGAVFMRHYETTPGGYPFEIDLHQHEWHELVWMRSPGATKETPPHTCTVDGRTHECRDGTLVYVPPFHPHRFSVKGPLQNWIIGIDQGQLCRGLAHSSLSRPLERLFAGWQGLPTLMVGTTAAETAALGALERELAYHADVQGTVPSLEAVNLVVMLDRSLAPWKRSTAVGSETATASGNAAVNAAIEYIERNFATSIGVGDCAAAVGVGKSTLSHQFRLVTGRSFPQWLAETRLRHARALLVETDLDIIEIALECGFNDQAWFARQFRAATGYTPSEWRGKARDWRETPN